MFCKQCGNQIREGAAFCTACGTKVEVLEAEKKDAFDETQVLTQEPVVEAPVAEVPAQPVIEEADQLDDGATVLLTEEAPVVPAYEVAPVVAEPVVEAPVVPAYEVAPVVEETVSDATVAEVPAYEVAPVAAEPVVEAPVVPAYAVAPVVAEPVAEAPVVPVVVEAPVVPAYAVAEEEAPKAVEPVYVPSVAPVQQSEEVKNNGKVGFGAAISLLFKNIVNFTGRASRSEFWFGYLFIGLINLGAMMIPYIGFLFSLATALPCISLSVRRIRDTGKNWNYIFMGLIPIAGAILLIITFCKDTDSEKEQ